MLINYTFHVHRCHRTKSRWLVLLRIACSCRGWAVFLFLRTRFFPGFFVENLEKFCSKIIDSFYFCAPDMADSEPGF